MKAKFAYLGEQELKMTPKNARTTKTIERLLLKTPPVSLKKHSRLALITQSYLSFKQTLVIMQKYS